MNTFPVNKKELQTLMQPPGVLGNRRIRESLDDLSAIGYLEKIPVKRKAILSCNGFEELSYGPNAHPRATHQLKLKLGTLERNDPRYRITPKFLDDMVVQLRSEDNENDKFKLDLPTELLLNHILARTQSTPDAPFVAGNYREKSLKNVSVISDLQKLALEWFFMRDYLASIFRRRKNIETIYSVIQKPSDRFEFSLKKDERMQRLQNIFEEDFDFFKDEMVAEDIGKSEAIIGLNIALYIPHDKILNDLVKLLVLTYPGISEMARQALRAKWKRLMVKEGIEY